MNELCSRLATISYCSFLKPTKFPQISELSVGRRYFQMICDSFAESFPSLGWH